jgi:uncharacterized protein YbjT (DUF2867 family)
MSLQVLVAGAAGALGGHVVRELTRRGHRVRALVHDRPLSADLTGAVSVHRADALDPTQLTTACEGVDVVFSSLGASVVPQMGRGRRSFHAVDVPANLNLIDTAARAGVGRFVYVGVAGADRFGHLAYVQAHEAVADDLRSRGMRHAVIRSQGLFSAFGEILSMAERGAVPMVGDGSARTNPIHDADVAAICADAVEGKVDDVEPGGPETLTRRDGVELAFHALGRPMKTRTIPAGMMRLTLPLIRPINPRMAELTAFFLEVSAHDLIVPSIGTRTLGAYYEDLVKPASAGDDT